MNEFVNKMFFGLSIYEKLKFIGNIAFYVALIYLIIRMVRSAMLSCLITLTDKETKKSIQMDGLIIWYAIVKKHTKLAVTIFVCFILYMATISFCFKYGAGILDYILDFFAKHNFYLDINQIN